MLRYTAPQYVIGNTSHGMLRRTAHRLHNGPNSGKDRKVVEEDNKLEEEIRLGIRMGELDTGHDHQVNEMQGADFGDDYIYPRYELGDTSLTRDTLISGLPVPPPSQTDGEMFQDYRLANYLQSQTDRMRKEEEFHRATTSSSQSPKALTPKSKVIGLSVNSVSTSTGVLGSSLPPACQRSQDSNAAGLPYLVAVDPSSARSGSTISTQSSQRPCSHDNIYSHEDTYSESPSYSILDNYTSEEEPLISMGSNSQSMISQQRSSPESPVKGVFADAWAKDPDHPAFRVAPLVPLKDVPKNTVPVSECYKSESFSKDQDEDGKGPGMEIELRPGMDEPKEYKQGPRIRQTEGNYF